MSKRKINALSSEDGASSSSSSLPPFWTRITSPGKLLHYDPPSLVPSAKIAGFDLDDTIVTPLSKSKFAKDSNDWRLLFPMIAMDPQGMVKKFKQLVEDGYKIIIFSNQKGISGGQTKEADVLGRVEKVSKAMGVPVQAFLGYDDDCFRKPTPDVFDYMEKHCNGGLAVDRKASFYVGDAAGRVKDWQPKKSKDFSCSDRKFAINCNIAFHTPEEFFLGQAMCSKFELGFDPRQYISSAAGAAAAASSDAAASSSTEPVVSLTQYHRDDGKQELVLLIGRPATGKTTFTKSYFEPHGYVHVNQDTLGSKDKCIAAAKKALSEGKSVVVDNTNPSKEVRAAYISAARSLPNGASIAIRGIHMQSDQELSEHLNVVRQRLGGPKVPTIAYNMFKSKFEAPNAHAEGMDEVLTVPFVPQFSSEEHKKQFFILS